MVNLSSSKVNVGKTRWLADSIVCSQNQKPLPEYSEPISRHHVLA
jgi:hypothetical protein